MDCRPFEKERKKGRKKVGLVREGRGFWDRREGGREGWLVGWVVGWLVGWSCGL